MNYKYSSFSQIPTKVVTDSSLTETAKILLCLVSSLTNEKGYCWASNAYFAEKLGKSTRTIARTISLLKSKGYILAEYSQNDNTQRKLTINYTFVNQTTHDKNVIPPMTPVSPPHDKNVTTPMTKMSPHLDNSKEIKKLDKIKNSDGKAEALPSVYPDFIKSQKAKDDYDKLQSLLIGFSLLTRTERVRPSKRFFGYFCGALKREGFERLKKAFVGYANSKDHRQAKYNWNLTALICEPSKIAMWASKVNQHANLFGESILNEPKSQEERRKLWKARRGA